VLDRTWIFGNAGDSTRLDVEPISVEDFAVTLVKGNDDIRWMIVEIVHETGLNSRVGSQVTRIAILEIDGENVEVLVTILVLKEKNVFLALPEIRGDIPVRYGGDSSRVSALDRLYPNVQAVLVRAQKGY